MNDNNSGLEFSNSKDYNHSTTEEITFSLEELLVGHNRVNDGHDDEDYHNFAGANNTSSTNESSVTSATANPPTSTINVNYYGFSEEAKNAFEYAVNIWEGWIKSDVPIEVDAYWQDLSSYGSGILGAASPNGFRSNFAGATYDDTSYVMSLANHLAGKDLNGGSAEIKAWFNSDFSNWYFGTDGKARGKYDFSTVVLHELGHGLGITDLINSSGTRANGTTIFDKFIVNGDNESLSTFYNDSSELQKQLRSNDLFFNGTNAVEANGGEQVKLYAPSKWQTGSSIAHLDERTYSTGDPDALMTPELRSGEVIHNPGAVTLAILEDFGWNINKFDTKPAPETRVDNPSPTPTPTPEFDFNSLESYAEGQDKQHTLEVSPDGSGFEITGNSWKKLAINYKITSDTILEFEYNSTKEGEIQGIGFDRNNNISDDEDYKHFFQLLGTDEKEAAHKLEYQVNSGWNSYQIRFGDYFTGEFDYLTFINDHDKGTKDAHSQYRNLRLYEEGEQPPAPETPVDKPSPTPEFDFNSLESYAQGQDKKHTLEVFSDGSGFEITGNSWKKLAIDYTITSDTILEFEYNSNKEGEIQGIGFETNNQLSESDYERFFQLLGTDEKEAAHKL
ncbi:MAG: hypothetical protein AAFV71_25050, partial [Cyanobacteria bacterium J06633_8]